MAISYGYKEASKPKKKNFKKSIKIGIFEVETFQRKKSHANMKINEK